MRLSEDPKLHDWLLTVVNGNPKRRIAPAGDFLKSLAMAGLRADPSNLTILYPVLLAMQRKYPEYDAAQ